MNCSIEMKSISNCYFKKINKFNYPNLVTISVYIISSTMDFLMSVLLGKFIQINVIRSAERIISHVKSTYILMLIYVKLNLIDALFKSSWPISREYS